MKAEIIAHYFRPHAGEPGFAWIMFRSGKGQTFGCVCHAPASQRYTGICDCGYRFRDIRFHGGDGLLEMDGDDEQMLFSADDVHAVAWVTKKLAPLTVKTADE